MRSDVPRQTQEKREREREDGARERESILYKVLGWHEEREQRRGRKDSLCIRLLCILLCSHKNLYTLAERGRERGRNL